MSRSNNLFGNYTMSDDLLFRWNLTIHLKCEKCDNTMFVEEVATGEIFCVSCGNTFAKSRDEWPPNWEQSAAFGTYSDEKSWMEYAKKPSYQSLSTSFSPTIDTSTTLSDSNMSSVSPSPRLAPSSRQIGDSTTNQPFHPSTSHNIERDQISNAPDNLYDAHLALLSKKLNLPDDIVSAAKRIILRVHIDNNFRNIYPRSKKIRSSLVTRAALLEACRQLGVAKTFKEIEIELPRDQKSTFHKIFKLMDSILKKAALTNPIAEIDSNAFLSLFSVTDFVSSQAKVMGLSDAIRDRAMAISENRDIKNLFSGRRANIGAAVVLAFAAGCEKHYSSALHYAQAANISVTTYISSLKAFLKFVEDMSKRGELPLPFRAEWNHPNYTSQKKIEAGVSGIDRIVIRNVRRRRKRRLDYDYENGEVL